MHRNFHTNNPPHKNITLDTCMQSIMYSVSCMRLFTWMRMTTYVAFSWREFSTLRDNSTAIHIRAIKQNKYCITHTIDRFLRRIFSFLVQYLLEEMVSSKGYVFVSIRSKYNINKTSEILRLLDLYILYNFLPHFIKIFRGWQ